MVYLLEIAWGIILGCQLFYKLLLILFWRQMLSLARGGLVTSKPRTNEPRRELGQRPRPKKGREWGMQWLKWSSLRGTGASAQASTGRECTGSRGQISNFVRRECELLAPPHQQLAGEQHGHYNWNATLQFWTNQTQTKCYKPWNIGLKLLTCSLGSLGPPDL